jgi:hypothetical protein
MRSFFLLVRLTATLMTINLALATSGNEATSLARRVTGFSDSCISQSLDGWILKAYCQDDVKWSDTSLDLSECFAYGAGGVLVCHPSS